MKKIFVLLFLITFAFSVSAQNDATEYNNRIIDEDTKIGTEIGDFLSSETHYAYEINYNIMVKQIDASIVSIENLGPWKNDATFREAALKLFRCYKSIADNEYKEQMLILKKPDGEFTNADVDRINALEELIMAKEESYTRDFIKTQEAFGHRWGVKLKPYLDEEEDDGEDY